MTATKWSHAKRKRLRPLVAAGQVSMNSIYLHHVGPDLFHVGATLDLDGLKNPEEHEDHSVQECCLVEPDINQ